MKDFKNRIKPDVTIDRRIYPNSRQTSEIPLIPLNIKIEIITFFFFLGKFTGKFIYCLHLHRLLRIIPRNFTRLPDRAVNYRFSS